MIDVELACAHDGSCCRDETIIECSFCLQGTLVAHWGLMSLAIRILITSDFSIGCDVQCDASHIYYVWNPTSDVYRGRFKAASAGSRATLLFMDSVLDTSLEIHRTYLNRGSSMAERANVLIVCWYPPSSKMKPRLLRCYMQVSLEAYCWNEWWQPTHFLCKLVSHTVSTVFCWCT